MSDKERAIVDWLDSVVEIQNRLKELDKQGDELGLMYCLGNMSDTIQLNSETGFKALCKALKIKKKDIAEKILTASFNENEYLERYFSYKGYRVLICKEIERKEDEQATE